MLRTITTSLITATVIFCGLLPNTSNAQGPHIGIKAGLNLSNLYSTKVDDNNMRVGFNGGLVARTMTDSPIGLQVELLYSTKGNRTTYQGFFGLVDQEVQFNLNYLELPVLVAFRFADNAVELQAGGYAAYLLSSDVTTDGDLGSGNNTIDSDKLNAMDFGVAAGLAFNAGPIQAGARYHYGLAKIADSNEADFLLGDAKNSCIQVFVAVGIAKN